MGGIGEKVNTNDVYLIKPKISDKDEMENFKNEFLANNENSMPGSSDFVNFDDYKKWLKHTRAYEKSSTVPVEGHVPATTYLLKRKTDKKILGILQIRHSLNDFLKQFGGNFGGSIRPTERNKGYSAKMINLGLKKAKSLGLNRILITCLSTNFSSAKSIEKAGGKFEGMAYLKEKDVYVKRYWFE